MDRVFNNPNFIKLISFLIALLLYMIVNLDHSNNPPGTLPTLSGTQTLPDVPITAYYHEDEYALMDAPDHVQVTLKGPQNELTYFQIVRPSYEVYIDLRELGPGTHTVPVLHRNFPNELSVVIEPSSVKVTIEEKRTISLPVEIDLLNKSELAEGYTAGTPITDPLNVEITAAESIIRHVAFVKGFIDVKGAKETIEKSVPLKVYDQQGNELQISVNPSVVDVKVPVTSPNKEVPIKINRKGQLSEGLSIRSITTDPEQITIFGPNEVIEKISFIEGVEIDLSQIRSNTMIEVEVPKPNGVEKVSPETVKIIVEVDVEEKVNMNELPIEIIGLSDRMRATFINPENGVVNIIAKGSPEAIQRLKREDIRVYIELNQLSIGEQKVSLQINGPQNITFERTIEEITVQISEVENNDD